MASFFFCETLMDLMWSGLVSIHCAVCVTDRIQTSDIELIALNVPMKESVGTLGKKAVAACLEWQEPLEPCYNG